MDHYYPYNTNYKFHIIQNLIILQTKTQFTYTNIRAHWQVAKANMGQYTWRYKLQLIIISEIKSKLQSQLTND